jgi:DedD protein
MDRRVKERLVGASILVVLVILIVPELLSGPAPPAPAQTLPARAPEPIRNVTVDLRTSQAPAPDLDTAAASSAQPPGTQEQAASAAAAAGPNAGLETPSPPPTSSAGSKPAAAESGWAVQLGSFASHDNADKLSRQLQAQGFTVYVLSGGSGASVRYRVRVGPMADHNSAAAAVAKLKSLGHAATIVPPRA